MTDIQPEAGKHDFFGACDPRVEISTYNTFSVGVFRWERKSSGRGLKKSPVLLRISGLVSEADRVYSEARRWCDALDRGEEAPRNRKGGVKTITVE